MKFQNKLPHTFGKKVNVGGTTYKIDSNGIISGVTEEHGKVLAQNSAWSQISTAVTRKPIKPELDIQTADLDRLKKKDLIRLCVYRNIEHDTDMKKSELITLLRKKD